MFHKKYLCFGERTARQQINLSTVKFPRILSSTFNTYCDGFAKIRYHGTKDSGTKITN